jgi:hypothetical protein
MILGPPLPIAEKTRAFGCAPVVHGSPMHGEMHVAHPNPSERIGGIHAPQDRVVSWYSKKEVVSVRFCNCMLSGAESHMLAWHEKFLSQVHEEQEGRDQSEAVPYSGQRWLILSSCVCCRVEIVLVNFARPVYWEKKSQVS